MRHRHSGGRRFVPLIRDIFPVRKMISATVSDYLGRSYILENGVPKSIVSENAEALSCR